MTVLKQFSKTVFQTVFWGKSATPFRYMFSRSRYGTKSIAVLERLPTQPCQGWGRGFESLRPLQISSRKSMDWIGPSGPFSASPARGAKAGKQRGSSRKRNVADSRRLAAWIGPMIRHFPTKRWTVTIARMCSDRRYRQPHTRLPGTRTAVDFASRAPVMPSRSSSLRPPAGQAHWQHKPARVRQSHEAMRRVEARRRFVQRVDDHHRRAHRIGAFERALQCVRQQD